MVGVKRTYYEIMTEQNLENERADIYRKIEQQEEEKKRNAPASEERQVKRQRFDDTTSTANVLIKSHRQPSEWDKHEVGDIK